MKKGVVAALALAWAMAAGPAAAQGKDESGIYLGGGFGYSQYKDTCKDLVVAVRRQRHRLARLRRLPVEPQLDA